MLLILMALAGLNLTDTPDQSAETLFGEMGFYGDAACFYGDSSRYYGLEAGVDFSPFRYTDVEIGFNLMSGNDQTFTNVNGRFGLASPRVRQLSFLCGVSIGLNISAPEEYMWDCDWPGRDCATGGWLLPYCGLEYLLRDSDTGYSVSIHSRVAFTDHEVRRISSGVVLSKSIYAE